MPEHTNAVEHEQYVLAGEYTVGIEGDTHEVSAGDSLLIPAGAVHWYENDGDEPGRSSAWCRTATTTSSWSRTKRSGPQASNSPSTMLAVTAAV